MQQTMPTGKIEAVYTKAVLSHVHDDWILNKFAGREKVTRNSDTNKWFAFRYQIPAAVITEAPEYDGTNYPTPGKINREIVEGSVHSYQWITTWNDRVKMYDLDDVKSSFLDIVAEHMHQSVETIWSRGILGGTNVVFAGGAASKNEVAAGKKRISEDDFDLIKLKLKRQRAKTLYASGNSTAAQDTKNTRNAYICVGPDAMEPALRHLPNFIKEEEYGTRTPARNEIGSYNGISFITHSMFEGEVIGGTRVYEAVIFGANAFVIPDLTKYKRLQIKFKPAGSAGTKDILDLEEGAGWKAVTGLDITNQAWIIKYVFTVAIDDTTAKHYIG